MVFGKNVFDVYFDFSLAHVPSVNMEGAGLMTYTAARHQGAIKMFWLHFWGTSNVTLQSIQSCFLYKIPSVFRSMLFPC